MQQLKNASRIDSQIQNLNDSEFLDAFKIICVINIKLDVFSMIEGRLEQIIFKSF